MMCISIITKKKKKPGVLLPFKSTHIEMKANMALTNDQRHAISFAYHMNRTTYLIVYTSWMGAAVAEFLRERS
jgi:hypothetical protein